MATLIHAQPDDEIADLIARLGATDDPAVGLVLPAGSRALQTPLNARLLSQFSRRDGRNVAIVSDEPRVRELARQHGFAVYPSVVSFQRGMELAGATPPVPARGAAATAVQEAPTALHAARTTPAGAPPPVAPPVPQGPPHAPAPPAALPSPSGSAETPVRSTSGAVALPAALAAAKQPRNRRLYIAGAVIAVLGLLLFFVLAPAATVTITVAATPLSVSPTIQGSIDSNTAKQGDHILTSVVTGSASSQFTANPTGTATLPPKYAGTTLVFSTNNPSGGQFELVKGAEFTTSDGAHNFVVTQSTYICIGQQGGPQPTSAQCDGEPPNATAPTQAQQPGTAGDVGAGSITQWGPNNPDPCTGNPFCQGPSGQTYDIFVGNPSPATGGADPKQVTVASQQDVSGWTSQVSQIENQLTNQINSHLQQSAGGNTFAVDPGGNGKAIKFSVQPSLPSPGAQFSQTQVTVKATGTAVTYNPADVRSDILADLNSQLTQGDQLAPDKLNIQPCSVTQAGTNGTVVLSCTATDFEQPVVNINGLKQQLAGKNPGDAQRIIEGAVDKVQDVQVSEFPFRLFYLPLFSSRIAIDENLVTGQSSSP